MSSLPAPPASDKEPATDKAAKERGKKISQAMRTYLERSKAHTAFMTEETAEFEIGKRHLAVIMGEDPDTFSQDDVDRAIQYLLPSALYDKRARPMLRHPKDVIPPRKAAQFDIEGRPFHSMFYTGKPHFFQLMHDGGAKIEQLQQYEDTQLAIGLRPAKTFQLSLAGSQWINKAELERVLNEKLSDGEAIRFVKLMDRLVSQTYAAKEKEFVLKFRKSISTQSMLQEVAPLQYDESGRGYTDALGRRKTALAQVRIWEKGSGRVTVNGKSMLEYFPELIDREQLLFPLHFCDVIDSVDVEATIEGGVQLERAMRVHSSQAGALRHGIALALQSMVSKDQVEKMRLAGLLTHDPRRRERKKPGQEGARRKFTWKKR